MLRVALWLAGTAAAVALMLGYRTSTNPVPPAAAVAPGVDGSLVATPYGPVQVRVTVAGGRLTGVVLIASPSGNPRTEELTRSTLPKLREQALRAQSADVDGVSGATYTSDAYRKSLQAALDRAGL